VPLSAKATGYQVVNLFIRCVTIGNNNDDIPFTVTSTGTLDIDVCWCCMISFSMQPKQAHALFTPNC